MTTQSMNPITPFQAGELLEALRVDEALSQLFRREEDPYQGSQKIDRALLNMAHKLSGLRLNRLLLRYIESFGSREEVTLAAFRKLLDRDATEAAKTPNETHCPKYTPSQLSLIEEAKKVLVQGINEDIAAGIPVQGPFGVTLKRGRGRPRKSALTIAAKECPENSQPVDLTEG